MFTDEIIAEAISPKIFSLIILPTEKCNFRCTYCYEDFTIGKMSAPIIRGLKSLLNKRIPELDRLNLSWFGGEPLLALDIVRDIGQYAFDLCQYYGVSFGAGFTTNGFLLTKELLVELQSISHNEYQITLDGDEEWHNKTRILANRRPTFEKIWNNLVSYRDVTGPFSITLRLHIHESNIESIKRLYKRIRSTFSNDKRFRIYFHKVSNLNAESPIKETVLSRDNYKKAISYIMGEEISVNKFSDPISEEHLSGYICYAAKPNSLLIRANGGIGKCTVALNDARNDIGRLKEDGTMEINNPKMRSWLSGFSNLSTKALGCPLSELS